MIRILATDGMDKSAIAALTEKGCQVDVQFYEPDALGAALKEYDAVVVRSATKVRAPHIDAAAEAATKIMSLQSERAVYDEQRRLVTEELQRTSQRVNLFEKVKIPECRDAIRVIKIALGDEQTAAVARGKIAKSRVPEGEDAA